MDHHIPDLRLCKENLGMLQFVVPNQELIKVYSGAVIN